MVNNPILYPKNMNKSQFNIGKVGYVVFKAEETYFIIKPRELATLLLIFYFTDKPTLRDPNE